MLGMPLPLPCKKEAEQKNMTFMVDSYESFRETCDVVGKSLWKHMEEFDINSNDSTLRTFQEFMLQKKQDDAQSPNKDTETTSVFLDFSPQEGCMEVETAKEPETSADGTISTERNGAASFGKGIMTAFALSLVGYILLVVFRKNRARRTINDADPSFEHVPGGEHDIVM